MKPAPGSTISGTVRLKAVPSGAPRHVEFTLDGALLSRDRSRPYEHRLGTHNFTGGAHRLAVTVRYGSKSHYKKYAFRYTFSNPARVPVGSSLPSEPALRPATAPPPLPFGERMGISLDNAEYKSGAERDRELDETAATGSRWVRFDIKWSDVQWSGSNSFGWAKYDALVASAKARGLNVLANLAYSPSWARPSGSTDKFAPDTTERREAYARFASAAVTRYRDRIGAWEIWNEPNNTMFWQPAPNASSYAALLRHAFPAVKAADPAATVIAGATSPASSTNGMIDEVHFIQGVYAAGGRDHFDAWSHHPYDFNLAPGTAHPDSAWWQTYGSSPSIRSVMEANGDAGKKVWATEYGLPSSGYGSLTEAIQAERLGQAFTLWSGFAWAGPIFNYMIRDSLSPGNAGYWYYMGVARNDWSRKPSFAVMQRAAES